MKPSEVLKSLNAFPKKQFGQNFLIDERALSDIVAAGQIKPNDTVVEVGPGLGVLTFELAKKAKRVIAIEADHDLAHYLRSKVPSNVDVIAGDALRIDWGVTIDSDYKIVANIPYSITSPLLRKIFLLEKTSSSNLESVVLLVQKELAERIISPAGKSNRGMLTILTEASAEAEIIRTVKSGSFYPMPKVDSAVIRLTPYKKNMTEDIFWPAVEAGFRHKRQTLANSLKDLGLKKEDSRKLIEIIGLDPMVRPQVLSFENWKSISQLLVKRLQS